MGLNGWQRLWIVGSIAWFLIVGVGVWSQWPTRPADYVSAFPNAGDDKLTIGYYDALAHIAKWLPGAAVPPPNGFEPVFEPNVTADFTAEGLLVEVPSIGNVRFPALMSIAQAEIATKELLAKHDGLLVSLNAEKNARFEAATRGVLRIGCVLALLPPLLVFAFAMAAVWVRRGFRPDKALRAD